ncbi:hypothetical protein BJ944DRAFT_228230 [Cunninghamella echinulata]|nr:hypothetical protein BJ944DRAFT_228230 [Cunninghamella echinulata]
MAFSNRAHRGPPTTIFASKQLSPRQIATKALTLGCKKLDRDDKRSRPLYNVRERLLLCNTIARAEEVLNKRTRRTNRRVMSAEDEEYLFDSNTLKHHPPPSQNNSNSHHDDHCSPLRASSSDEEDEQEQEQGQDDKKEELKKNHQQRQSIPSANSSISSSSLPSTNNNNNNIIKTKNDHTSSPILNNGPNTLNQPNGFLELTPESDYRKLVKHPMISPIAAL